MLDWQAKTKNGPTNQVRQDAILGRLSIGHLFDDRDNNNRPRAYLWVFKPQFSGQLLSVGFTDVLLFLEHLLQALPLHVGEDGPPQHSPARLAPHLAQEGEGVGHRQQRGPCNKRTPHPWLAISNNPFVNTWFLRTSLYNLIFYAMNQTHLVRRMFCEANY